jgi:hypothetical protein
MKATKNLTFWTKTVESILNYFPKAKIFFDNKKIVS